MKYSPVELPRPECRRGFSFSSLGSLDRAFPVPQTSDAGLGDGMRVRSGQNALMSSLTDDFAEPAGVSSSSRDGNVWVIRLHGDFDFVRSPCIAPLVLS
ncbi:hypothetical protein [Streptomyces sp. NPDC055056]